MAKNKATDYGEPAIFRSTWVVVFAVSASFIMFLLRYNLSVAIVSIINEKLNNSLESSNQTDDISRTIDSSANQKYPFDEILVGQILASYFYGYTLCQLPAGRISELFGGKWLLGFGTLIPGILTFLSPFILDLSPYTFIACRVIMGTMQCAVLTSSYTLLSEWLPSYKIPNAITLINVGFELGGVSCFYFTGQISNCLGWRYSFHLFSLLSIAWFLPFCFLVSSRPDDDPKLSKYERKLIEEARTIEFSREDFSRNLIKIPPKFDWKVVFTSGPVWASSIAKAAAGLGYYMVTTRLPSYLNDIFDLPVSENGFLVAVACSGILSSKILCFYISDSLRSRTSMSLTNFRKCFQSLAMLVPATCLFIITLKNDNQTLDIFLIFLAMFGKGFVVMGDTPITAEFASNLSGSIFGVTNTFACLCGVIAPVMSSTFLQNFEDDKIFAWNLTFYVTILLYIIALIIFLLFASAEPQKWAECEFRQVDEFDEKANNDKFSQLSVY